MTDPNIIEAIKYISVQLDTIAYSLALIATAIVFSAIKWFLTRK